jgi:hypothetical protein
MLTRVFVLIAVLAWNSNAASLQSSASRQDWQDLEVITLDSKGNWQRPFITATISCLPYQR